MRITTIVFIYIISQTRDLTLIVDSYYSTGVKAPVTESIINPYT